jgi:transcriptional regulator with XRE-family HTH domain
MREGTTGVAGVHSPTVRRRELGTRLRTLRTEADLTVEQVAEHLLCSPSKISRLETGHRGASARDIRDLCDLYQVDPAQRDYLAALAREGSQKAWWQPYDLPYATYVGLEAEAIDIRDFEPSVVPGLLQTPAYTQVLHEHVIPQLDTGVIVQRVDERRRRQEILTRDDPPRLDVVLDQSVLHRVVGGSGVMAEQLGKLLAASSNPAVTIRILPFSAGAHPALESTFVVLQFPPPIPGVVYAEGLAGHMYRERPEDVRRYKDIFEHLSEIALTPGESVALVAQSRARYEAADGDPRNG